MSGAVLGFQLFLAIIAACNLLGAWLLSILFAAPFVIIGVFWANMERKQRAIKKRILDEYIKQQKDNYKLQLRYKILGVPPPLIPKLRDIDYTKADHELKQWRSKQNSKN